MIQLKDGATVPQTGQFTDISQLFALDKAEAEILARIQQQRAEQAETPQTPDKDGAEKNDEREKEDIQQFPADCLPDTLRQLADNVAEATNTPAVISYAAGLASVAASLGGSLRLETNPGEFVAGNLFIIPIVDSGIGKSRASKAMLKALYDIHDSRQNEWLEGHGERAAELEAMDEEIGVVRDELQAKIKKKSSKESIETTKAALANLLQQKKEMEKKDIKPELYTGNTTEAKLATLLRDNDEVMNAISTEAGSAVQILAGKYSNADRGAIKTEDTLLLSAYCQERYKNDRATTDCVDLHGPTVNLLWMIQPRYIKSLFGNLSLASGGFLARCLAFNSQAEPQELLKNFHAQISRLFEKFRFGTVGIVKCSNGAREVMRQYYNECVRLRRGELRDIQQFPARWAENAWKISLVLHALHTGEDATKIELSEETATDAIQIMRWFSTEFLALMRAGREDKFDEDGQWLVGYIIKKGVTYREGQNSKSMSVRDIARSRFQGNSDDVRQLVGNNPRILHIDFVTPPNGGAKSERVFVGRQ